MSNSTATPCSETQAFCLGTHQSAVATKSTHGGTDYIVLLSSSGSFQVSGLDALRALRKAVEFILSEMPAQEEGGDA